MKKIIKIILLLFVSGVLMAGLFIIKDKFYLSEYSERIKIAIEENDIHQIEKIIKEEPRCVNSLPTTAPGWLHTLLEQPEAGYPLQTACLWGRYEITRTLLENGADCNLSWKGIWGSKSPLSCAVISDAKESEAIIELLLEYGADKTYVDECGKTAYDYAVENGNLEFQELLN